MLKYSVNRICLPGFFPGMVSIAISLLLTGSSISPDIAQLSIAQIARLPKSVLSRLYNDAAVAARYVRQINVLSFLRALACQF